MVALEGQMTYLDSLGWFAGVASLMVSFVAFLSPWAYQVKSRNQIVLPKWPHQGPWRHCNENFTCYYTGILYPLPYSALGEGFTATRVTTLLSFLLTSGMLISLAMDAYFRYNERKSLVWITVSTVTGVTAAMLTLIAMVVWATLVLRECNGIGWAFWMLPVNLIVQMLGGGSCVLHFWQRWRGRRPVTTSSVSPFLYERSLPQ